MPPSTFCYLQSVIEFKVIEICSLHREARTMNCHNEQLVRNILLIRILFSSELSGGFLLSWFQSTFTVKLIFPFGLFLLFLKLYRPSFCQWHIELFNFEILYILFAGIIAGFLQLRSTIWFLINRKFFLGIKWLWSSHWRPLSVMNCFDFQCTSLQTRSVKLFFGNDYPV